MFVPDDLKSCYYVDGSMHDTEIPWKKLMLSRRTRFVLPSDGRSASGLVCCSRCKMSVNAGKMPKLAIANGFCFGTAPECLTNLTEIELAFITPVKTYGYCFSYSGGFQKQLKGTLSYYKVKHESIARTVAHFSVIGITDNIVVLLSGPMTADQSAKVYRKSVIRPDKVIAAVKWLCVHNAEWRACNIDFVELENSLVRLCRPTLIDNSYLIEGSNSRDEMENIEHRESFQVFFPDSAVDDCTGAQRDIEEFREMVQELKKNGYNLEVQADLMRSAVSDYQGNNLVNTCLLQYPYGRGGLHERRQLENGVVGEMDILEYVLHLSNISNACFHHELFVLILYNMKMKLNMVRCAYWKVRHKATAEMLSTELNEEDIELAVQRRRKGVSSMYNSRGDRFLKAIDAIARSVPHTNEAAKKARRRGECLQHHFGMPTHFMTVTPDDESSILIQIFSGENCDLGEMSTDAMSPSEIANRIQKRVQIRLHFPGICALVFQMILGIIVEEVIGWDQHTNKASNKRLGFFGCPEAFTASIEEQGRKTLHVHFQIWVKEIKLARDKLFSPVRDERREGKSILCKEADRIMSTSFIFDVCDRALTPNCFAAAFPHKCRKPMNSRRMPAVVCDQTLRDLRYKSGSLITGNTFAKCLDCTKKWTNIEFVQSYILHGVKDRGYNASADKGDLVNRMKTKAIEYQKKRQEQTIPTYVVETAYNMHIHTRSCFKRALRSKLTTSMSSQDKQRAQKRMLECECRYRLPVRKKTKTTVENVSDEEVKWYSWNGTYELRKIKELSLKRRRYDLFQNQSCPAIGRSKLSCNTNINFLFHGSTGQYSFKYNFKNTQAEDREEFDQIIAEKDRILSKINRRASVVSEASRRLLLSAFAHQRANICGGPMSSYLTRNTERFIFSHETVWIPLRDLKALLAGRTATSSVIYHNSTPFFQCIALHYLARPKELESCCSFDFYAQYEFVRLTKKNEMDLLHFCNTAYFQHPSFRNGKFLQGVRNRKTAVLPQVFQYDFPDTAEFKNDILTSDVITDVMEEYAELVLLLFMLYRCKEDMIINGSFTEKLRAVARTFSVAHKQFLQNLQDAKSNCFRIMKLEDDLQRCTHAVTALDFEERYDSFAGDDVEEDTKGDLEGEVLDTFLDLINNSHDNTIVEETVLDSLSLDLRKIKDKGRHNCGYSCLASMSVPHSSHFESILVENEIESLHVAQSEQMILSVNNETECSLFNKTDLLRIVMTKISRKTRSFKEITGLSDDVEVLEANGSIASIMNWAQQARLDRYQRRSFEVIIGTFILTFYRDAKDDFDRRTRHTFIKMKHALQKLVGEDVRRTDQLICLLHGPGGSGKTTVIDLTIEYAKEYCSYIENMQFTSRTIVVTALTGVAATIIGGETTHSAVFLNQKRALEAEQIEMWENTRLLIVDEVSFASKTEYTALDKNLRCLKQNHDVKYGGLSIVFSGDLRQLEPIGENKKSIYDDNCPEFSDWINCYLPLKGKHRFVDDPEWGKLLYRFREGLATIDDINLINTRVVSPETVLPTDIRYATFYNRDRDAINTALFEKRCCELSSVNISIDDSILILSDNIEYKNGTGIWTKFLNSKFFWENCGEDDIKLPKGSGRMDPVLRLYRNCPVMIPTNINVQNGQANGTQAFVDTIVVKNGARIVKTTISDRISVQCVMASDVEYVHLRHANSRIHPESFKITPKKHTFKAKIPKPVMMRRKANDKESVTMRAIQIPILVNNATTGHKLQGSGVEKLFIHSWSYVTNWVYVMLSRVKTMQGLYLREPLSTDLQKYKMSPKLKALIEKFEQNHSVTTWNDDNYANMLCAEKRLCSNIPHLQ